MNRGLTSQSIPNEMHLGLNVRRQARIDHTRFRHWAMFGTIWFVQVVHYPLFVHASADFASFESHHRSLTTLLVAPLMLAELLTAALLLFPAFQIEPGLCWSGFALLAVAWASTFLLQVPIHDKLSKQFQATSHRRLVETNWIRTTAWSIRALLAAAMLWKRIA